MGFHNKSRVFWNSGGECGTYFRQHCCRWTPSIWMLSGLFLFMVFVFFSTKKTTKLLSSKVQFERATGQTHFHTRSHSRGANIRGWFHCRQDKVAKANWSFGSRSHSRSNWISFSTTEFWTKSSWSRNDPDPIRATDPRLSWQPHWCRSTRIRFETTHILWLLFITPEAQIWCFRQTPTRSGVFGPQIRSEPLSFLLSDRTLDITHAKSLGADLVTKQEWPSFAL